MASHKTVKLHKLILGATLAGVLSTAALIGTVILTGNTFGQRCSAVYGEHPVETEACVNRLQQGGPLVKPVQFKVRRDARVYLV